MKQTPLFSHIKRGGNQGPSDEWKPCLIHTGYNRASVRQGHVIAASDNTAARETQGEKGVRRQRGWKNDNEYQWIRILLPKANIGSEKMKVVEDYFPFGMVPFSRASVLIFRGCKLQKIRSSVLIWTYSRFQKKNSYLNGKKEIFQSKQPDDVHLIRKLNIAPEKWWLEHDPFLLGPGLFSGANC